MLEFQLLSAILMVMMMIVVVLSVSRLALTLFCFCHHFLPACRGDLHRWLLMPSSRGEGGWPPWTRLEF